MLNNTDYSGENKDDFVSMMTIHGCKGLEFKIVFLIGVNQGIIPS
jgi:DNA helicase-2/ATP-dependent DNA helicase PcrA